MTDPSTGGRDTPLVEEDGPEGDNWIEFGGSTAAMVVVYSISERKSFDGQLNAMTGPCCVFFVTERGRDKCRVYDRQTAV